MSNPSTLEAEAQSSRLVNLCSEFQNSQGYVERPCITATPPKKKNSERTQKSSFVILQKLENKNKPNPNSWQE